MYVWNFTKPRRLSRHFPPRLELLIFPEGWRAELLIFPEFRLRIRARCSPPAPVQTFPTAPGVVEFPRNWRPARVRFPPSRGTNPDIFCPLLESLAFPYEKWSPCGLFTKPGAKLGIFCTLLWTAGFSAGLRVWYFHRRRVVFWHFWEIGTHDQRGKRRPESCALEISAALCAGQALGLRSAWPSKTLPGQGP